VTTTFTLGRGTAGVAAEVAPSAVPLPPILSDAPVGMPERDAPATPGIASGASPTLVSSPVGLPVADVLNPARTGSVASGPSESTEVAAAPVAQGTSPAPVTAPAVVTVSPSRTSVSVPFLVLALGAVLLLVGLEAARLLGVRS
jgi:hypothetical protein